MTTVTVRVSTVGRPLVPRVILNVALPLAGAVLSERATRRIAIAFVLPALSRRLDDVPEIPGPVSVADALIAEGHATPRSVYRIRTTGPFATVSRAGMAAVAGFDRSSAKWTIGPLSCVTYTSPFFAAMSCAWRSG